MGRNFDPLTVRGSVSKDMSLLIRRKNSEAPAAAFRGPKAVLLFCLFMTALGTGGAASEPHLNVERVVTSFSLPPYEYLSEYWFTKRDRFASRLIKAFKLTRSTATEFSDWILEASERQKLNPNLIASLVFTESTFRKNVTSVWGAIGPAQIRADYWQKFCGVTDLSDPEENVYCGAQILAYFQDMCGHQNCALRSYNLGFRNRNNSYFSGAGNRYLAKIESNKNILDKIPL